MKRIILSLAIILTTGISAQAQTTECDNCHGKGLEERTCAFCGGNKYRECDFCLGKKMVRCNDCGGTGNVFCAHCNGKGGVNIKGEWHTCQWCDGKGTPECERCKKTGQIVCWKCEGAGEYVCNQCQGSGVNEWQCHVCGGTGKVTSQNKSQDIPEALKHGYSGTVKVDIDPNDSEEEKMRKMTRARLAHRKKMMEAQGITVK